MYVVDTGLLNTPIKKLWSFYSGWVLSSDDVWCERVNSVECTIKVTGGSFTCIAIWKCLHDVGKEYGYVLHRMINAGMNKIQ